MESSSPLPSVQLWGCDHVYNQFVKLFIQQVLEIQESSKFEGTFLLHGHPMVQVNIMGYVVSVVEKENFSKMEVDDGTGVIPVTYWKHTNDPERYDTNFHLGELVNVYGKLNIFREQREIKVDIIQREMDPNTEVLFWLDAMKLDTLYRRPFNQPILADCENNQTAFSS